MVIVEYVFVLKKIESTYLSISDTAKALKVSDTAVRLCINGINKTCKGYILEKYK